jgi:hypothetical protein
MMTFSFSHSFCYPDPTQVYFSETSKYRSLPAIASSQLTRLNDQGSFRTYVGTGFLPENFESTPIHPGFNLFLQQCSPLDRAIARISPPGILFDALALPPFILSYVNNYIRSQNNQSLPDISCSVQPVVDIAGDIAMTLSHPEETVIDSSADHDEQEAMSKALDNAPFDVKSWLPVSEDVDMWDESETTVANMCLDAVSVSVDLENGDMDVDVDVVDPQMDDEDVGDMSVDVVEQEIDELDSDVLDELPGDDTGEVEASEEEEDDGTVVVQAQPAVVQTLPIPVHVPFLTAIPNRSGGPGGRGKLFFITFHPILI